MRRWFSLFFISLFAVSLSGCGIKGGLKTPPPLWGDNVAQTEAEPSETDVASTEDDIDDIGYGVDVSKNP